MFVKYFCPFRALLFVNKIKIVASNCNKFQNYTFVRTFIRNSFFSADLTTGSAPADLIIFAVYVWCIFGLVICASTAAAVAANSSGSSAVAIVQQHKQAAVDQVNGDRRRRASIKLCE